MERIALIVLSILVATLLLVGASLGAVWLQPYIWHAAQQNWFPPLIAAVVPVAYIVAQRFYRRTRTPENL